MARGSTIREGVVVGLIAYAAVAAFYAAFDLLAARGMFFTLNLLGRAVFRGLRDPGVLLTPVALDVGAMMLYNALHLVLSLAIGFTVTRLVFQADDHPDQGPICGFIIIAGFVVTIMLAGWLSVPIRAVLPWWSIVVANASAVVLAGMYFLRRHPGIWRRLMPVFG